MNQEYSYIAELSNEEKKIFVESFCCLVCADKKIMKEEIDFLKKIGKMYGIAEQDIVTIMKGLNKERILESVKTITNRRSALNLIKELCYLANSDDDMGEDEIDFILDVTENLGIDTEKLKQINKWVLDKIILYKTGDIILEKE